MWLWWGPQFWLNMKKMKAISQHARKVNVCLKEKMCSSGEQCGLQVSFPIVTKKMVLVTTKEEK